MIRINLLPKKRKATRAVAGRPAAAATGAGQWWLLAMLIGWLAIGGVGYWLLGLEDEIVQGLRTQSAAKTKEAETISKEIDEEGLDARKKELELVVAARENLKDKKRTPVYVMYELAMILTDAKEGGGPDIDKEKLLRSIKEDPNNALNERWDPSGLWLRTVTEKDGALIMEGSARDASDLAEFTRRLRASARFGQIKHPDFQRVGGTKADDGEQRMLEWKLDVAVRRWD
jgi:hypothetical protein